MMKNKSIYMQIPFVGDINKVDKFYEILGVEAKNGCCILPDVAIIYGSIIEEPVEFHLGLNVDKTLDEIKKLFQDEGIEILNESFDATGPNLMVKDPAGFKVRIGFTVEALNRMM